MTVSARLEKTMPIPWKLQRASHWIAAHLNTVNVHGMIVARKTAKCASYSK
jgi:hypothetical protein